MLSLLKQRVEARPVGEVSSVGGLTVKVCITSAVACPHAAAH